MLDYLLVIIPIFISCVAIGITISISKKQNKIELFNVRYKCISQIESILSFSKCIEDCKNSQIIITVFDSIWGTDGTNLSFEEKLVVYRCKLEFIKFDVSSAKLVFKHKFHTDPFDLVFSLHELLMVLIKGEDVEPYVYDLNNKCNLFYEKDFQKIVDITKI